MSAPDVRTNGYAIVLAALLLLLTSIPIGAGADEPPTRSMLYGLYTKLSDVDGSFLGEATGDSAGRIRRAGDVNGDGLNDFQVMAWMNDEGGTDAGQTYLILGKEDGWSMDRSLANVDASFIGEAAGDQCGDRGSEAGDVNGDGFDDLVIPACYNDAGGTDAGQAYLVLGKSTGWKMDTVLSNVDGSFIGEYAGDQAGFDVSGGGDVNGDGYDDLIIASPANDENGDGAGQVYLFLGSSTDWGMDTNCSDADASLRGEAAGDGAGYSISMMEDVNGDGLDEIGIASRNNNEGGTAAGQCYIVFGKKTGWAMDTDLSNADASFWGENANDLTGDTIESRGDLNGDGYNDVIIGSMSNSDGGSSAGQVYIIFGKRTGWSNDVSLANADASFVGEAASDQAGWGNCLGDVNMDGYDDIVVGAVGSAKGGTGSGQVYVVLGKGTGWKKDVKLSTAAASFYGEAASDQAGRYDPVGDINGDGAPDLVIGAAGNDQGATDAGQAYVVFLYYPYEPSSVDSIKIYRDQGLSEPTDRAQVGDKVYIKLTGTDSNPDKADMALVNVSSAVGFPKGFRYWLRETGANTGIYSNNITITTLTDPGKGFIKADIGEYVNVSWTKDPTIWASVMVSSAILLTPIADDTLAIEDAPYLVHYENMGFNEATDWEFGTTAGWLHWDAITHNLSGTPDNKDVGEYNVSISISDGLGNVDDHFFHIYVVNTPPSISAVDDVEIMQDERFELDLESDDEGIGDSIWSISPSYIDWLELDPASGMLSGTPINIYVGAYDLNVSIEDGNGGSNRTRFNLTVLDKNDPPVILTQPPTEVLQGYYYYVQFNAMDVDDINSYHWSMSTDADFLTLDEGSGFVSGTPGDDDVGAYFINVTAEDQRGLTDSLNYTLAVIEVNDIPVWVHVPSDTQVEQGDTFTFDTDASDPDGNTILYRSETQPHVDMSIDGSSGEIKWVASLKGLLPDPYYLVQVTLYAYDGELEASHWFTIRVIPNPSPKTTLIAPLDEKLVPTTGTLLRWESQDDSAYVRSDVHLSDSYSGLQPPGENTLFANDINGTYLFFDEGVPGRTYFWTVLPRDEFSTGTCTTPIWKFTINTLPRLDPVPEQTAIAGSIWRLHLQGADNETDKTRLALTFVSGPQGMSFAEADDDLVWTPSAGQVGEHVIMVSVHDGLEGVNQTFTIVVIEPLTLDGPDDDGGPGAFIFVFIGVILLLVLLAIIIPIVLLKRRKPKEEPPPAVVAGGPFTAIPEQGAPAPQTPVLYPPTGYDATHPPPGFGTVVPPLASDQIDDLFQVPQAPALDVPTGQGPVPHPEVVDGDIHQTAPERKAMITEDMFQDGASGQNAAQPPPVTQNDTTPVAP